MDWSLITCGLTGHVTYAPSEPALRDRLRCTSAGGTSWRCLRCGGFVPGEPQASGPADEAPAVGRGKQLRDAFVLRIFAVERLLRVVVFGLAAYGVWRFSVHRTSIRQVFERDLPLLRPLFGQAGLDFGHSRILRWIQEALGSRTGTLHWIAAALAAYAVIELVEAVGLWSLKRWGEYFAFVATAVFLPLEIYELTERISVLRVGALLINLILVAYLVWTKHLFGVRGGRAAYEAERRSASLIEIERAAT